MKKELQRKLSFVLFVMAVFFAGMALTVFCEYIWMAGIAGVLLLAASVFLAFCPKEEAPSATEKTTELLMADRMAELMRGNEKAEKGVYIAVKKQHEAMESGIAALREPIAELMKAQETAVKTLVMYNKENAKQMALSEREELGRLRAEIHDNGEAILAELGTTLDSLEEIKEVIEDMEVGVPATFDREPVPADDIEAMLAQAVAMPDVTEPTEDMPEETTELPEEPEMELIQEEPEEEEKPEDALASSGVDLSDPNKTLSADDIAALFAAMGN